MKDSPSRTLSKTVSKSTTYHAKAMCTFGLYWTLDRFLENDGRLTFKRKRLRRLILSVAEPGICSSVRDVSLKVVSAWSPFVSVALLVASDSTQASPKDEKSGGRCKLTCGGAIDLG